MKAGDKVEIGDPLMVMIAMKMEVSDFLYKVLVAEKIKTMVMLVSALIALMKSGADCCLQMLLLYMLYNKRCVC